MNLLLCLKVVGMWTLEYLHPSFIENLDSGQIRVELSDGRAAYVVKDPHANQYCKELNGFQSFVYPYKISPD